MRHRQRNIPWTLNVPSQKRSPSNGSHCRVTLISSVDLWERTFAAVQSTVIPSRRVPRECRRPFQNPYIHVRCCKLMKAIVLISRSFVAFFGVPVKCPKVPLAELFWNVQTCDTDEDCWPRVCCPDGRKKFCRTPNPEFKDSKNPFARQLTQRKLSDHGRMAIVDKSNKVTVIRLTAFKSATSFIQCTAPSRFDIHPQACNTTLDCFPNLCCQEGDKRYCRPPQRSLFSRVANSVSQTLFGN